jgi:hypothetical protein
MARSFLVIAARQHDRLIVGGLGVDACDRYLAFKATDIPAGNLIYPACGRSAALEEEHTLVFNITPNPATDNRTYIVPATGA